MSHLDTKQSWYSYVCSVLTLTDIIHIQEQYALMKISLQIETLIIVAEAKFNFVEYVHYT